MPRIKLAPWQLSLAAAFFIVFVDNKLVFQLLVERVDLFTVAGFFFVLTLIILMVWVMSSIFLVVGIGRLQKPLIATFLIGSAIFSFFTSEMGVVFDAPMILNMAETVRDRNSAEAIELLSLALTGHVVLFGVLPALLLLRVDIVRRQRLREFGVRAIAIAAGAVVFLALALPNYRFVSFTARENHDLGVKITPIFPLASIVAILQESMQGEHAFTTLDADATRHKMSARRTVGVMVVGETARADHFSMNGYVRDTNPRLQAKGDVWFANADSCGTSTLYSIPCMFSMRGREDYSPDTAADESNVLDILVAAGVDVVWIDNNSSCKHVCARVKSLNLRKDVDPSSPFFSESGNFDEILVGSLEEYIDSTERDTMIVLHTLGSHGPAYNRRYPPAFATFTPACDEALPTECGDVEVLNAYDNTIVYTDYILSEFIDLLKERQDNLNSFLFYASDHGESLGENGMYLHGVPYAIAPSAQTNVPFIVWLSDGFRALNKVDAMAAEHFSETVWSHDNISHTLLGFYNVDAGSYSEELDVFAMHDFTTVAATPDSDQN